MIVETHNRLSSPQKFKASRVLVTSDDGLTPIALILQYAGSSEQPWFRVFRVGDKDFNAQLDMHGVNRTVVVTDSFDFNPKS
jgi:hypothetical protein